VPAGRLPAPAAEGKAGADYRPSRRPAPVRRAQRGALI